MSVWNMMHPTEEEKNLILTALETVQFSQQGYYYMGNEKITFENAQYHGFEQVIAYSPQELCELRSVGTWKTNVHCSETCRIRVMDLDSFEAAKGMDRPLVFNFANARRPGGGFLHGGRAQEEALCRAGTLYLSLSSAEAEKMYRYNRDHPSPVDSDYMLLSPKVCVFRNPIGELLNEPYYVSVISASAPDRIYKASQVEPKALEKTIRTRLQNLFMVAVLHGYRSLVLGAWGCGAFGNDVNDVSRCFYDVLIREGFARYFDTIVFAVFRDSEKLWVFRQCFAQASMYHMISE